MKKTIFYISLALRVLVFSSSVSAQPVDGLIRLNESNQHFYMWSDRNLTWQQACDYTSGYSVNYQNHVLDQWHLATITSEAENNYIYETVLDKYSGSEVFIGGHVVNGSLADFEWVTGESFKYSNFAAGQPDYKRENVLEMAGEFGRYWNDEDGPGSPYTVKHSFVMEHNPAAAAETTPEPATVLLLAAGGILCRGSRKKSNSL